MKLGKKDKIQLGVTAVMVAVLCFLVGRMLDRAGTRARLAGSSPSALVPLIPPEEGAGLYERLAAEAEGLKAERDPFFKQRLSVNRENPLLILKGIAWDEDQPSAIINEDVVRPGDMVTATIRVERIEEYRVYLSDGEKKFVLSIAIEDTPADQKP